MSADVVDRCAMLRFALTPSLSPTLVGEGSAKLSVKALPSDQRLCSTKYSVRPPTH